MTATPLVNLDLLASLIEESANHEKTFKDNLELWRTFYNNRDLIIRKELLNPKLFIIIKFLLQQEKGEIFQYFHSNIIKILEREQEQLTFQLGDSKEKPPQDIEKLFTNLELHDKLSDFLVTLPIEDIFGDIKQYTSKTLTLYTVDSLVMVLHDKFFELSPEVVRKTIDFITDGAILIQGEKIKTNPINKFFITKYLTKLLPIKQFIGEDLRDDKLIKKLKEHQLKDKKLFIEIFNILDYKQLLEIFGYDLSNFLKFLDEADYIAINKRKRIVLNFFYKLIEEEKYTYLLDLIINNSDSPLRKWYLDTENYNEIILGSYNTTITSLTSKQIIFLLTIDFKEEHNKSLKIIQEAQGNFMIQCSYLVRKGTKLHSTLDYNIDEIRETLYKIHPELVGDPKIISKEDSIEIKKEKVQDIYFKGYDIDINIAVELLKAILRGQIKDSSICGQAIIRSIGTYLQEQLGIESNGIYFYDSNLCNGRFEPCNNAIGITYELAERLISLSYSPILDKLNFLDVLPHEIEHNLVNQNQKQGKWDISSYEMLKEDIIRNYAPNFYDTNYLQLKKEIDASIAGANEMQKLVELFLPEYLDKVQDKLVKTLETERTNLNQQDHNRSMKFLKGIKTKFQLGFDTLVKYNPTIIEKNPILKLEYHSNGQPKTYEEIWLGRTEENKDLIDGILKLRYPEPNNQVLTK